MSQATNSEIPICEKIEFSQKEVDEMRRILCIYLVPYLSDKKLIDEFLGDIEKQNEEPDFCLEKEGFYFVHLKKEKFKELFLGLCLGRKKNFI